MDSIWVLGKDLIKCVRGALSLGHANTDLSLFDAFLNFQKLFLKMIKSLASIYIIIVKYIFTRRAGMIRNVSLPLS